MIKGIPSGGSQSQPLAHLSGQVMDNNGKPVAGIGISANAVDAGLTAWTDPRGHFNFGVHAGQWNLGANSYGQRALLAPALFAPLLVASGVDQRHNQPGVGFHR